MAKKLSVLGIDIAKQVFHLVGMDAHGAIVVRKRLYRAGDGVYRTAASDVYWYGDLWRRPLLGTSLSGTWP